MKGITHKFILSTIVLILTVSPQPSKGGPYCSEPATQDQPYTFTDIVDGEGVDSIEEFQWSFKTNDGRWSRPAKCSPPPESGKAAAEEEEKDHCTIFVGDGQLKEYDATAVKLGEGGYKFTLTINNVSRNRYATTWVRSFKYNHDRTCDLRVQNKCATTAVEKSSYTFTQVVYHQSMDGSVWYWEYLHHSGTWKHVAQCTPTTSWNRASCTVTEHSPHYNATITENSPPSYYALTLTILEVNRARDATSWKWSVGTDIKGSCQLEVPHLPTAGIRSCSQDGLHGYDGYLDPFVPFTCQCYLPDPGIPPGTPSWTSNDFDVMDKQVMNDGVSTLSIEFNPLYPNATYSCFARSSLGSGTVINFTPLFAYGPTKVVFFNTNKDDIPDNNNNDDIIVNKCNGDNYCQQKVEVKVECRVHRSDVFAEPSVTLEGGADLNITAFERQSVVGDDVGGEYYRYGFIVTTTEPDTGGIFPLTCVAANTVFPLIRVMVNRSLTVQVPPSSPPILSFFGSVNRENDNVYFVLKGPPLVVNCIVPDGYPPVTSVSIRCRKTAYHHQHHSKTPRVETSAFVLLIDDDSSPHQCTCTAEHITGCYNKTTSAILLTTHRPMITSFTVNSQEINSLEVSEGDGVSFACKASGYPRHWLTFRSQRSKEEVTLGGLTEAREDDDNNKNNLFNVEGRVTKAMTCEDTDTYVCHGENEAGQYMDRNVYVAVKCSPRLNEYYTKPGNNNFRINSGDVLEFEIFITCYPRPIEFVLNKTRDYASLAEDNGGGTQRAIVESDAYEVSYISASDFGGIVSLRMTQLRDASHNGKYVLSISNGVGVGLDYEYDVIIESSLQEEVPTTTVDCQGGGRLLNNFLDPRFGILFCFCHVSDNSNFTGTASWLDTQFKELNQFRPSLMKSLLRIEYNPRDPRPTYFCVAHSPISNWYSTPSVFKPRFAYGPTKVYMNFNSDNNSSIINTCDVNPPELNVNISCNVPIDSVYSRSIVTVTLEEGHDNQAGLVIRRTDFGISDDEYYFTYGFNVIITQDFTGGSLTVKCVAKNEQFPTIEAEITRTLIVQVPPSSPPTISVDNIIKDHNASHQLIDGQKVTIECNINGGYPMVESVTISCQDQHIYNRSTGSTVMFDLQATKDLNLKTCNCMAEHASSCYNKATRITLNVFYNTVITTFTVNSQHAGIVEVEEGEEVIFTCTAEGNPKPRNVTIRGQRSTQRVSGSKSVISYGFVYKSLVNKRATCEDTDTYTCQAAGDDNTVAESTMGVVVKCSPRLYSKNQNSKTFKINPNGTTDLEVEIPVMSYPRPNEFVLHDNNNNNNNNNNDNEGQQQQHPLTHDVTYIPMSVNGGIVTLRMFGLDVDDKGMYILSIKNGEGSGLEYVFQVVLNQLDDQVTENPQTAATDDDNNMTMPMVIGAAGGVVVLVVVVAIVVVVVCLKRKAPDNKSSPTENRHVVTNTNRAEVRGRENGQFVRDEDNSVRDGRPSIPTNNERFGRQKDRTQQPSRTLPVIINNDPPSPPETEIENYYATPDQTPAYVELIGYEDDGTYVSPTSASTNNTTTTQTKKTKNPSYRNMPDYKNYPPAPETEVEDVYEFI